MRITPQIRIKARLTVPKSDELLPKIPIAQIANRLMADMTEHWKASLMTGRKPSGGSLPTNKHGKPMGVGHGSFIKAMTGQVKARKGRKLRANKATAKLTLVGLDARHAIAWNDLHKNEGMDFQSKAFAGRARSVWESLIEGEMQKLSKKLAKAMAKKRKGKQPPIEGE